MKERIIIMRGQLIKLKKKIRGERIIKRVQSIRKKGLQGIWEFKKKFKKKKQIQKQLKNEKGRMITCPKEIIEEYEKYYKDLLKTKEAETKEEKDFEELIETQFEDIREEAKYPKERRKITPKVVAKAIKQLQTKKASDRQGWRTEWLKNGGKVMEQSLCNMFNKMEEENRIPNQWKVMSITSINKKSSGTTLEETQRGIFVTNIVSKVYIVQYFFLNLECGTV